MTSGRKCLRIIGILWLTFAIGTGVAFSLLENTFVNFPRVPDAPTERTVPYEAKDAYVYVTASERELMWWLSRAASVGLWGTLGGVVIWRVLLKRRQNSN
jgi:hypothetical protein